MNGTATLPRAAGELLHEIVRAFKVRRLYAADHPQRTASEASATASVAAILAEHGAFAFTLEDGEVRFEEEVLQTTASATESSLVSILYQEGIRELAFHPGLSAGELARFLDHVAEVAASPLGERDLLARLWEETLPHIHYVFVERLADQEWVPEAVERAESEAPSEPGPIVLEPEDQVALDLPLVSLPDPTAYRLTEEELAHLQAELEDEKARTLLHEALTCIREILFDPPHEDPTPVLASLVDIQARLLAEGRLREVRALHDVFEPYRRSAGADPRVERALERLRSEALDGGAVRQLVERVEAGHAGEEELVGYLEMFGPELLPGLLAALPELKRLCQRPAVASLLAALAGRNTDALGEALARGSEPVAIAAAYLSGALADDRLATALERALERPEPRVRLEAVQALKHLGDGAVSLVGRVVDDPDPTVRVYALRHVIAHGHEPAFPVVAALFDSIDEQATSLAERRLVYEAFGALGGARAVEELSSRMTRRGVFRRGDPEATACAVAGLAATGLASARELVEQATRDRDERVREAARAALASWGRVAGVTE